MKSKRLPIAILPVWFFLTGIPAYAQGTTNPLCVAAAANMEEVAKGRDRGVPAATAHAEQTGDIDNKIIGLIYETPHFSPQQEKEAVTAVCNQTDAFLHGVGVSDDAPIDKIDSSIIKAIRLRLQMTQH